jgi:hypothetical protein
LDDAGRTRFRNRVAEGLRNGFASALGGGCNAGVGMIVCAPQDIGGPELTAMRTGLYPGTFDPITLGHIDIIKRACRSSTGW